MAKVVILVWGQVCLILKYLRFLRAWTHPTFFYKKAVRREVYFFLVLFAYRKRCICVDCPPCMRVFGLLQPGQDATTLGSSLKRGTHAARGLCSAWAHCTLLLASII